MESRLSLQLTDVGNAERFVATVGDRVRHSAIRGWMVWDGKQWVPDSNEVVFEHALTVVRNIPREMEESGDRDAIREITNHSVRSQSKQAVDNMLSIAARHPSISVGDKDMDADHWMLACANGMLDLRTGKLHANARDYLNSYCCGPAYHVAAPRPQWTKFMQVVFDNRPELIRWVQKAVGYSLTGSTREQCLFFLFGSGLNGKSTFIETVSTIMGNYAAHTPSESFMSRSTGTIRNDLARLVGKRMVVASEVPPGKALDEVGVKSMTGEEDMAVRFLHHEFFEYRPQFKIWLSGNHKPSISGTDFAIWRRIRIIPFNVTIDAAHVDKDLRNKLLAESEGILAWAVEGCQLWQVEGLSDVPEVVVDSTQRYREEQDPIGFFVREACAVAKGLQIQAEEMYGLYLRWCGTQNEVALSRNDFHHRVQERVPTVQRYRIDREWWFTGIAAQRPVPLNAVMDEADEE